MIGNEEDFTACLGFEAGTDESLPELDVENFRAMIELVTAEFPNLEVVATTLRTVRSATVNDWGAIAWSARRVSCSPSSAPGWRSSTGWAEATASPPDSSTGC